MPEIRKEKISGKREARNKLNLLLLPAIGLSLLAALLAVALISYKFPYGKAGNQMPVMALVVLLMVAGLVYLLLLKVRPAGMPARKTLAYIFFAGVAMRLILLPSHTILEDDIYRYLWDGAVVSHLVNPYRYSPEEILKMETSGPEPPALLPLLARQSGDVAKRINHPHLRSIYPMTVQLFFGLAHWLRPWSIFVWRALLLVMDILNFILLMELLRKIKWPASLAVFYWWNPLLIFETFNGNHMDILIFPFLLGAFLVSAEGWALAAGLLLALAGAAKVWPVLLLPFFIKYFRRFPARKTVTFISAFLIGSALLYSPLFAAFASNNSGFLAYGRQWELNDALFKIFVWGSRAILPLFGLHPGYAQQTARIVALLLVTLITLWLLWRRQMERPEQLISAAFFTVAVVFIVSPTQFPWYFIWLAPFLVFNRNFAIMLLTLLLPLYFLRYYFAAIGRPGVFDNGVVWLEFVPVWLLLIKDFWRRRQGANVLPKVTV